MDSTNKLKKTVDKYRDVTLHAIPSLIAIIVVEMMNVEVYLHGPVSQGTLMLLIWLFLQTIAGFGYGYLSDRPGTRKKILIISQILGVISGLILSFFGFEIWVLILIAVLFNPIPVARAAFLDVFSDNHSSLKLIALTLLAQYSPWVFFSKLRNVSPNTVVFCLLGVLSVNVIFTVYFFQEKKADCNKSEEKINLRTVLKSTLVSKSSPLPYILLSFILAESTFYLLWTYIEYHPPTQSWLAITTIGTLIGIGIAMFYNKLPHISVITLFYSIGAAMTFVGLLHCYGSAACDDTFIRIMSLFAIVGGLYMPFVTDAVIDIMGKNYRGTGSAIVEFSNTIAAFVGPAIILLSGTFRFNVFIVITIFYILAATIQKIGEKKEIKSIQDG